MYVGPTDIHIQTLFCLFQHFQSDCHKTTNLIKVYTSIAKLQASLQLIVDIRIVLKKQNEETETETDTRWTSAGN